MEKTEDDESNLDADSNNCMEMNVDTVMADVWNQVTDEEGQTRLGINQTLIETQEKVRLERHFQKQLEQCGWKNDLKEHLKVYVQRKGAKEVSVEDLVAEISPKAKETVPNEVQKEMIQQIKGFLDNM